LRIAGLGVVDEVKCLIGDEVGEVVEVVGVVMFDPLAVVVDAVVVEATVADQTEPFRPPGRHVDARILVQVLAEVACKQPTN